MGDVILFLSWTCRYSLGSVVYAGIICAMLPGNLLWVTSIGVDIFFSRFCFVLECVFLCYDTTGSSDDKSLGGA